MREQIVKKINNQENFELFTDEVRYIVKNWIEMQSQHRVSELNSSKMSVEIILDKDSIFKI